MNPEYLGTPEGQKDPKIPAREHHTLIPRPRVQPVRFSKKRSNERNSLDLTSQHFPKDTMYLGDHTMLRIGSMNMLLQGVENSAIIYRDSLAQDHAGEIEKYTLVLANPIFGPKINLIREAPVARGDRVARSRTGNGRASQFVFVYGIPTLDITAYRNAPKGTAKFV
jgi:hypothetical protein